MQFLDFFDFITNSVMMPIAAVCTCLLVVRVIGLKRLEAEVKKNGGEFRRQNVFEFMIRYICFPILLVILLSSLLSVLGVISM